MKNIIIEAPYLFDGHTVHREGPYTVVSKGNRIQYAGPSRNAPERGPAADTVVKSVDDGCILPGLMDSHVHLTLGTGLRTYEETMLEDSDSLMMLRCLANARLHLAAGVTAVRDMGARRRTTFAVKEGVERGVVTGLPRMLISGRPITMTGGHFFFCDEEADGPEEVRKSVRRLSKEGADFIKIMASGGGTAITDNRLASYTTEELAAIAAEAARHELLTTAHCIAVESIVSALDAGIHCIEHFEFMERHGKRRFNEDIGKRMVDEGVWLSPTIQTGYRKREHLLQIQQERPLTESETARLDQLTDKVARQADNLHRLLNLGAERIVHGTDAIAQFGDYTLGLKIMVNAGMDTVHALRSATSLAADCLGLADLGSLQEGCLADMTVSSGKPFEDIAALDDIRLVVIDGQIAHESEPKN